MCTDRLHGDAPGGIRHTLDRIVGEPEGAPLLPHVPREWTGRPQPLKERRRVNGARLREVSIRVADQDAMTQGSRRMGQPPVQRRGRKTPLVQDLPVGTDAARRALDRLLKAALVHVRPALDAVLVPRLAGGECRPQDGALDRPEGAQGPVRPALHQAPQVREFAGGDERFEQVRRDPVEPQQHHTIDWALGWDACAQPEEPRAQGQEHERDATEAGHRTPRQQNNRTISSRRRICAVDCFAARHRRDRVPPRRTRCGLLGSITVC